MEILILKDNNKEKKKENEKEKENKQIYQCIFDMFDLNSEFAII